MKITAMTPQDLPQVQVLAAQLGYSTPLADLQRGFEQVSRLPTHQLYVAHDDDGVVLGWLQVNRESVMILADADERAEVAALVVDEKSRGQGVGKALLQKAEEWAQAQGIKLLRLRSNTVREEAHRFYRHQGYELKKSWHLFVKEL